MVSFTTLGYGDITLTDSRWRIGRDRGAGRHPIGGMVNSLVVHRRTTELEASRTGLRYGSERFSLPGVIVLRAIIHANGQCAGFDGGDGIAAFFSPGASVKSTFSPTLTFSAMALSANWKSITMRSQFNAGIGSWSMTNLPRSHPHS